MTRQTILLDPAEMEVILSKLDHAVTKVMTEYSRNKNAIDNAGQAVDNLYYIAFNKVKEKPDDLAAREDYFIKALIFSVFHCAGVEGSGAVNIPPNERILGINMSEFLEIAQVLERMYNNTRKLDTPSGTYIERVFNVIPSQPLTRASSQLKKNRNNETLRRRYFKAFIESAVSYVVHHRSATSKGSDASSWPRTRPEQGGAIENEAILSSKSPLLFEVQPIPDEGRAKSKNLEPRKKIAPLLLHLTEAERQMVEVIRRKTSAPSAAATIRAALRIYQSVVEALSKQGGGH